MIKTIFSITTILFCFSILSVERIVFHAFPSTQDGKKLDKNKSSQFGILIKQKGSKYIWASREDRELEYSRSGLFHIFTEKQGTGIISIVGTQQSKNSKVKYHYGEHLRYGINIISYIGSGYFFAPN